MIDLCFGFRSRCNCVAFAQFILFTELEEIQPLIDEYFVCNTYIENDELKIVFLNGQNFILRADVDE